MSRNLISGDVKITFLLVDDVFLRFFFHGGPRGTRTPDFLHVRQTLYQLSYRS